jgi:hypothetical protein
MNNPLSRNWRVYLPDVDNNGVTTAGQRAFWGGTLIPWSDPMQGARYDIGLGDRREYL